MKKTIPFLLIVFSITSCKMAESNPSTDESEIQETVNDSVAVSDKDKHGCLASAGYIWSKVNNECIKIYTGIPLNPIVNLENEDQALNAYVLFDEKGNQAELFLPNQENSMLLTRKDEGQPWTFGEWQLVAWKGYILKQNEKTLFSGDGEIGSKILGSDTEE